MAVRKFFISNGQSNSGPFHDWETWAPKRPDINLIFATQRVSGAGETLFTVPGNFPGFTTPKQLKGVAIRPCRYLVFYNPVCTGYTSYPGTGRVANSLALPNSLVQTTTDVIVEQRFKSGSNGIASIFRKKTQTTHTVSAVTELTKQFLSSDVSVGTNQINMASHGFTSGMSVRVMTTGVLPTGLSPLVVYYVNPAGANAFTLSLTPGGAAVTITTATGSGTHTILHATTTATAPALIGSKLTVTPAFDPPPVAGEEFTFDHKANASGSTTTAVLSQHYGLLKSTGQLTGLVLKCLSATNTANNGVERVISAWNDATRTVTTAAFPAATSAGDTFQILPQNGVSFAKFAMFLPWSLFERDCNASAIGDLSKTNPYPPGFDYPSHWHLPQFYGMSNQPVKTSLFLNQTMPFMVSWHIGGLVRLAEFFGEEVWMMSCDFGGSSTYHDERELGQETIGWYDKAQQRDWAMSKKNGCFQRFLDELDAAIAAAAAVGDTLECIGIDRVQGDGDSSIGEPGYGALNQVVPIAAPAKFLDSNRQFRKRVRQEITNRGLWSKDPSRIPWVQLQVSRDTADANQTTLLAINSALEILASEDRYAACGDTTGVAMGPDNIHYLGGELDKIEALHIDALFGIFRANDQTFDLEVSNLALSLIAHKANVTSLDPPDGSAESKLCARFLPVAVDSVFEQGQWGFSMKRRKLFRLGERELAPGKYAYVLPSLVLRVFACLPDGGADDQLAPFQLEVDDNGAQILLTSIDNATIRYVERGQKMPANFRKAVAWELAALIAGPITKDPKMVEFARTQATVAKSLAGEVDGQQRRNTVNMDKLPTFIEGML